MALVLGLCSLEVFALPGVIVGKGDAKRVSHATQVVLMKKGEHTVVTVWADYEGPLDEFALVLPVPKDVSSRSVKALKRDAVDHLDQISAPRFHEFWEMDACQPGTPQQEWERDLRVKSGSGFLGAGLPDMSGGHKLPKELQLDFEPQFKQGEFSFRIMAPGRSVTKDLRRRGMTVSAEVAEALDRYQAAGMAALVAQVRPSEVELIGAQRALLSPIRFSTKSDYQLPVTLGVANSPGHQELVVYVMHPERRFEVANYSNAFPPTNASVDHSVKERMGDFYAGVHDALLANAPKTFLVEYAWPTVKECGQPCPNAPMMIHELLTLGADQFEVDVPKAEKNPAPPPMGEEEQARFDAADKKTKKRLKELRQEATRRRALLDRNRYVITRLHHRYDRAGLPSDVAVRPAGHVEGGLGTPQGADGAVPTDVKPSEVSRLQLRYNFFHPSKKVSHCDGPERYRWGKAPRSYRGLRKIWTARDLAYKQRDRFDLKSVVKSSIPALGIAAALVKGEATAAATSEASSDSSCSVSADWSRPSGGGWLGFLALASLALAARGRRAVGRRR